MILVTVLKLIEKYITAVSLCSSFTCNVHMRVLEVKTKLVSTNGRRLEELYLCSPSKSKTQLQIKLAHRCFWCKNMSSVQGSIEIWAAVLLMETHFLFSQYKQLLNYLFPSCSWSGSKNLYIVVTQLSGNLLLIQGFSFVEGVSFIRESSFS